MVVKWTSFRERSEYLLLANHVLRIRTILVDDEIETMLKNDVIEPCSDNKGFKTQLFFKALIKNGLILKSKKILVLKSEVPFLGRTIEKERLKPDPRHVDNLNEILLPRTWKQLQELCGRLVWLLDFLSTK